MGISGSVGSYLAEYIVEHYPEIEVHGTVRWHSTTSAGNLYSVINKVFLHECDLTDFGSIFRVINTVKPDAIFHIASYANVRVAFETPIAVMNNNILSTINLFETVRMSDTDPVILLASTSEVYGDVDPKNVPIKETCPMRPVNPYAVSKTAQDLLGFSYFKNYKMKIIRTRMFGYINPRREDLFATAFALQIAKIEAGLQKELLHGNLDSIRTLLDIRDVVEAYWIAITKCTFGEDYNIGSTIPVKVGEILDMLKGMAKCKICSKADPKLLRPTDVTLQIPDTTKFTKQTGWKPKYTLEESLQNLLEHCRKKILRY